MKSLLIACTFLCVAGAASAQTKKKDTSSAIPKPPTVTVKRFDPQRIVKDKPPREGRQLKKKPVLPPPPPEIVQDSALPPVAREDTANIVVPKK